MEDERRISSQSTFAIVLVLTITIQHISAVKERFLRERSNESGDIDSQSSLHNPIFVDAFIQQNSLERESSQVQCFEFAAV